VGVIALGLAILGMIAPVNSEMRESGQGTPSPYTVKTLWLVVGLVGLIFAIGRFNPLYWQIADLPGFNFFRVPARWLALFVLSLSLFSGMGLHILQTQRSTRAQIVMAGAVLLVLMIAGYGFPVLETKFHLGLVPSIQEDMVGSAIPTTRTLILWGAGLFIFILIVIVRVRRALPQRIFNIFVVVLVTLELFLASSVLPYNDLTPRDVYEGQSFTISQLLAFNDDRMPPGRVLSISRLYFDPGDKARLLQRYQRLGMDEQAIQTAFTAVKRQEMLYPNLSLTWGIPSVDGFGGGVLPTSYYSQFTSLMLPEGTPRTVDGRLGELMA
jgi:hypothetical protein